MTQLIDAIYEGKDFAKVKKIIDNGANVNQGVVNEYSHCMDTPLYSALEKGNEFAFNCAKYLLEHGAAVDAVSGQYQETPLFRAVGTGNVEFVKLLLKYKAKVNATNRNGDFPLLVAVERSGWNYQERAEEFIKVAKVLIENGADVNKKSENGYTPLGRALYDDSYKIERILKEYGAH